MKINEKSTLSAIQQEFIKQFPNVKIEFYKQTHAEGEGSPKSPIINGDLSIAEIQKEKNTGTIEIQGDMKVSEVEAAFASTFNVGAQVFRRSGNVWLQTTTTDELTLNEQNKKALEREETIEEDVPDAMDRQELE